MAVLIEGLRGSWLLRLAVGVAAVAPCMGVYLAGRVKDWSPVSAWAIVLSIVVFAVAVTLPDKRTALWFALAAAAVTSLDILEALGL